MLTECGGARTVYGSQSRVGFNGNSTVAGVGPQWQVPCAYLDYMAGQPGVAGPGAGGTVTGAAASSSSSSAAPSGGGGAGTIYTELALQRLFVRHGLRRLRPPLATASRRAPGGFAGRIVVFGTHLGGPRTFG